MSEHQEMSKRLYLWLLVVLGIMILLALTLPQKHLFSGIALGMSISLYNLWLLQRKIRLQAEAAAKEGRRTSTGTISRFAAAALGTLIAMQLDWSLIGYIVGLMTLIPVIMIDFIWHHKKTKVKER